MKIKNRTFEYSVHLLIGSFGLVLAGAGAFNLLAPADCVWMNWWQILGSILFGVCLFNVKYIDD